MADSSFVASQGAFDRAAAMKTQLANATMHLFQDGWSPAPTDDAATFISHECDFDGYEASTIATWQDPLLSGNAWAIFAPTQVFRWEFDTASTGNMVAGYFLLTAAGHLVDYTVFSPSEPMTGPGMAIVRTPVEVVPWG